MLQGIQVPVAVVIAGGLTLLLLLVFQSLVGWRKIRFQPKVHWKVHRWVAVTMLVFAVVHALAALTFLGII